MFAGLPGIGVGTLFYVLTALWMPFRELRAVARGESSLARWRLIVMQVCFAVAIVASIAIADRVLTLLLNGESVLSLTPARFINQTFAHRAPQSVFAAPIMASFLLLAVVVLSTEVLRLWLRLCRSSTELREHRLLPQVTEQSAESQLS
jgi:hypothetical protein